MVIECVLIQAGYDNDIATGAGQPAVKGNDSVVIVDMEDIQPFPAQGRVLALAGGPS